MSQDRRNKYMLQELSFKYMLRKNYLFYDLDIETKHNMLQEPSLILLSSQNH